MKLYLALFLCMLLASASKSTLQGRFGRLFRLYGNTRHTTFTLSYEPSRLPSFNSFVANIKSSIIQSRLRTIIRQIQRSPKLQNFLLNVTEKCLSYGLFMLAFKIVSNTLATSWNEINTHMLNIKENSNSVKVPVNSTAHEFLKPNTTLNSYEEDILQSIILPSSIENTLEDIGGLDTIKETLCDILQPIHGSSRDGTDSGLPSSLFAPTRSVLLYGPPGCGKTMLARALCRRLSIPLLSVAPSMLLRMYVGETPRLTKALFSLASKLQPCMIFIDEADSLFCARGSSDHAVDRKIVTEFMQLWDELLRGKADVYVLGATNRPQDLDPAILRRFERSIVVSYPDIRTRKEVFSKTLRGTQVDSAHFDLQRCAEATDGYTSSDIVSVCRTAAMVAGKDSRNSDTACRPLQTKDILKALKTVFPTSWAAADYARKVQTPASDNQPPSLSRSTPNSPDGIQFMPSSFPISRDALNSLDWTLRNIHTHTSPHSSTNEDEFDVVDDEERELAYEVERDMDGNPRDGVQRRWGYDEQISSPDRSEDDEFDD